MPSILLNMTMLCNFDLFQKLIAVLLMVFVSESGYSKVATPPTSTLQPWYLVDVSNRRL